MKQDMTPDRWQKLKRIFNEALELEKARRKPFLDEACGEDKDLREETLSLLEAYESPGILNHMHERLMESIFSSRRSPDRKGEQVGPYTITKLLDHGGMGNVYLAERSDGQFEQQVALKLLRTGITSETQTLRFLSERQILATLHHENIAHLLDGGITAGGQPWFAMEYVKGRPIDEYCDERQLTIPDRLRLFLKVCSAVQFAHRKLVVHRDLKPSNILVTEQGTVKLLDFGIAKVLNREEMLAVAVPMTSVGMLPLTPAYASPEQVRGSPITTASDVYQLGVVLYELLTGCRPYEVSGRTPGEVERIVCEEQPTRPSTAITKILSTGENSENLLQKVGTSRRTNPSQLSKILRGDLDTILLKAIRKEPERRYDSAEQMAFDIQNFLSGRPVTAHPDSLGYRTKKFLRRNKLGVAAATMFVVLLIGYAATVTWHSHRTQMALELAQTETVKAEQVTNFLIDMLEVNDPGKAMGDTVNTRLLLQRGIAQAGQLNEQPDVQARMFDVAGRVYLALGQYDEAQPLIRRGLNLRKTVYGEDHLAVSESLHNLARLHKVKGDYKTAGKLHRASLEIRKHHLPPNDPKIAESLYHLGMYYQRATGNMDTAESYFSQSLEIRKNNYGSRHPEVAQSLRGLGGIQLAKGNYEKAERYYLESLSMQQELLGDNHPETLTTVNNLAILKAWSGAYDSATALLTKSLGRRHQVLGPGHPGIAIQLNNLAFIAGHQGHYKEAKRLLNEAISIMEASVEGDHPHTLVFSTNLARIMHFKGEWEASEKLHREALNTKRILLGANHPDVAASLIQLSSLLNDRQRYHEAETLLQEAISIHHNTMGDEYPLLISSYFLMGRIYMNREDYRAAGNMLNEALKLRRQNQVIDHPDIAVAHSLQGACLTDLELYKEAETLISNVKILLDKLGGEELTLQRELLQRIVNLYEAWEKPADAEEYRKMLVQMESQSQ